MQVGDFVDMEGSVRKKKEEKKKEEEKKEEEEKEEEEELPYEDLRRKLQKTKKRKSEQRQAAEQKQAEWEEYGEHVQAKYTKKLLPGVVTVEKALGKATPEEKKYANKLATELTRAKTALCATNQEVKRLEQERARWLHGLGEEFVKNNRQRHVEEMAGVERERKRQREREKQERERVVVK